MNATVTVVKLPPTGIQKGEKSSEKVETTKGNFEKGHIVTRQQLL